MSEFFPATFEDYEANLFHKKSAEQLTDFILLQSDIIAEAERLMRIANVELEARGTTIDKELEKTNDQITST